MIKINKNKKICDKPKCNNKAIIHSYIIDCNSEFNMCDHHFSQVVVTFLEIHKLICKNCESENKYVQDKKKDKN